MSNEEEKAELVQSIKALAIPAALFLATIVTSAGGFLLYNEYPQGWFLIVPGILTVIIAFVAMVRFQNHLRAKGHYKG